MYKALVIDDDSYSLQLLTAMLGRYDYDVHTSNRGDHGVDMAHDLLPDLILVDLLMPKSTYDGAEVAQILRSSPGFENTPIVAISAADATTIRKQLIDSLFTDFVQKPITIDKLDTMIESLDQINKA